MEEKQNPLENAAEPKPAVGQLRRRASDIEAIGVELVSGLFILLGLAAFGFLFVQINSDPTIQEVTQTGEGSIVLAFLDSFGIVFPLLLIIIGAILIRLGLNLRQRTISAARWAQVALIWLTVGIVVLALNSFISAGRPAIAIGDSVFDTGAAILAALPLLIACTPLILALIWISRIMNEIFEGEETLTASNTRMAWNLLIPTLALLTLVAARPLEETFITSLTDKRFAGTDPINFVAFENYGNLLQFRFDSVECRRDSETNECQESDDGGTRWNLIEREYLQQGFRPVTTINLGQGNGLTLSGTDTDFLQSFLNTLYYTVISVVLELVIGLFVAMVVASNFIGRGFMRTAMLVPWAIPTVISARLWEIMLRDNQSGFINKFFTDIGLLDRSYAYLADPNLQLNALIAVDVWKTVPFMALLLLAGLNTIPKDLYEAGAVDGANPVTRFFRITLPLLRPTIAVALVFRTLDALRAFDVFQVLLGRRKLSMATYNYETLVQAQDGGYASAIGVLIFILIFIFAIIYVRTLGVETE
jgi:trehalose/maltose transport system permease protein